MVKVMSATEARVHFGDVLRRVQDDDETIIVERDGEQTAVVISVAAYRRLTAIRDSDGGLRETLARAHALHRAERGDQPLYPPVEDVIDDIREERDGD